VERARIRALEFWVVAQFEASFVSGHGFSVVAEKLWFCRRAVGSAVC